MKKILKPFMLTFLMGLGVSQGFAQAGAIDPTYGFNGRAYTEIASGGGVLWGMSSMDGWSIVVGGLVRNNIDSDFAVSRYDRYGKIDSSFGVNGIAVTQMGPGADVVYGTMIQPDGKVIAAGTSWDGTKFNYALARYSATGVLDTTFGDHGRRLTSLSSGDNIGAALGSQDGWSIVVGGIVHVGSTSDYGLIRYTRDGSIDSTFGTNGIVLTDLLSGSDDYLAALAFAPDSGIIAAGTTYTGTSGFFSAVKYTKNGALNTSFGTGGRVVYTGTGDDETYAMALQPDGKVVIGGYSTNGTNDDFGLIRLNADGTADNTFGTNGHVITAVGDSDDVLYGMLLQPDGRIVVGGSAFDSLWEHNAVVRYNADGTPDNTFGTGGIVGTSVAAHQNEIYALHLETDGKIMAAGYANNGANDLFCMVRYISDLTIGVIDLSHTNGLMVYPNPVPQDATLKYSLTRDEEITIRLIDAQGRVATVLTENEKQTAGDHAQPIHLSPSLTSGTYTICISSASGQMNVRIVK